MLCIIAHPSIRVASAIVFFTETSTFNAFFKSAFDVGYISLLVSLNQAVGIGASSYENKSFILILSVEFKYSALEKIISVLYTSSTSFVVFIVTTSHFIFDQKPLGKLVETNSFAFYQSLLLCLYSQFSVLLEKCIHFRGFLKYGIHSRLDEYKL